MCVRNDNRLIVWYVNDIDGHMTLAADAFALANLRGKNHLIIIIIIIIIKYAVDCDFLLCVGGRPK